MQFFGTVVNIYQQKVVQKQILDKVILIKTLFIGSQKTGKLECRQFSHHVHIVAGTFRQKNIFQLIFIKHFKKLIAMHYLAVRRRRDKSRYIRRAVLRLLLRGRQRLSFHIQNTEVNSGDFF